MHFETTEIRQNSYIKLLYDFANGMDVTLFLVGGSVRDLLLNRSTHDFDFTLASDAIMFAKEFSKSINAPFIQLEENPATARVIANYSKVGNEHFTMDFAQYRAASLVEDLQLRDLTINAMAIPLKSLISLDRPELIDPCDGINDLTNKLLKYPSEEVLLQDPLRLLRIFRFAAQLDFQISPESISYIKKNYDRLSDVSVERIRDEFLKILNSNNSIEYIQEMLNVGLLMQVFPEIKELDNLKQALIKFEDTIIPDELIHYKHDIDIYLSEELGAGASRYSLIKLCLLLSDNIENVKLLRLSGKAIKFSDTVLSGYRLIQESNFTEKEIVNLLRITHNEFWGMLVFSAAMNPGLTQQFEKIVDIYYNHFLPIINQGQLITGRDIISKFQLKEGKQLGDILKLIEDKQFLGEIKTQAEAFDVVETLIEAWQE
ncbi:CCA tRNA nucleotidyltransferase [Candidatus Poribacteria bacterium]|nr:CCA tRNA nucleotidyltransferase [Candidatus Poribacteria bacterium]